ncbi:general odorant-binding protein 56d-like [Condylostylus longicornis]|uniref:general odorant-binding protein 56d-like n=1 Tax=Condylostylus longicornis TaxID=2530218 RepID=UPI00244DFCD3|nr:general odorant-binding protein 56d-like [Condylostylus longicornis]
MKFITSLVIVVICISYTTARLSGEQKEQLKEFGQECTNLIRISEQGLKRIGSGNLEDLDFNEKCWIECVFERLGILRDGQIQTSVIMGSLTSMGYDLDTATGITFQCENPQGENACERAHDLALCYLRQNAGLHHRKRR